MEEFVAQVLPGGMGEVGRVAVAVFGAQFPLEELAHFLPLDMDGGKYNMARRLVHELHDALSEVALDCFYAALFQIGGEAAFFGEHGLAFDQVLDSVLLEYVVYCLVVFQGVFGPMYVYAVGSGVAIEHLEVVGEVGDGMHLGACGRFPEGFPFGDGAGHVVPFLAHEPEGLVVPVGARPVGYEFFRSFGM